ncbi:MAG: protein phosphatase 2C domain-containing protein [Gemmataceae bacterium]
MRPTPPTLDAQFDDLLERCRLMARVLEPLHAMGVIWLNFNPGGLFEASGRIQIQGLDLQLFHVGEYVAEPHGLPAYASPEWTRGQTEAIGPATDVYHVALYVYYYLADLLPLGLTGAGPAALFHELPPLRVFNPHLPVGIEPILLQALDIDPSRRPSSVVAFVDALAESITRARLRFLPAGRCRFDVAGASVTGRSHRHTCTPNQDVFAHIVLADGTLLALVADGVTTAQIGSGEQASAIARDTLIEELCRSLPAAHTFEEIRARLNEACWLASQNILHAALAQCEEAAHMLHADLMCSTVVIAVVRQQELITACLGDSRVYLVQGGQVEQLTVDGDVRTTYLIAGCSSEEVMRLGAEGFALYEALGIMDRDHPAGPVPDPERSQPTVRRWPLQPGDLVVLCTDGLVEAGAALSPTDLVTFSQAYPRNDELAEQLVLAADQCQRDPSPTEPAGFGDDATCIVIRIESDQSSTGKWAAGPAMEAS